MTQLSVNITVKPCNGSNGSESASLADGLQVTCGVTPLMANDYDVILVPLVRGLVRVRLGSSKVIQTAKTHFLEGVQRGPGLTLTLTTETSDN